MFRSSEVRKTSKAVSKVTRSVEYSRLRACLHEGRVTLVEGLP